MKQYKEITVIEVPLTKILIPIEKDPEEAKREWLRKYRKDMTPEAIYAKRKNKTLF